MSNWLTVPLFVLAWPVALMTDNLLLAVAVFTGVVVAWRWGGGLGPADGKIAVGLAGVAPSALVTAVFLQELMFLILRARGKPNERLPAAVAFYLVAAIVTFLEAGCYLDVE